MGIEALITLFWDTFRQLITEVMKDRLTDKVTPWSPDGWTIQWLHYALTSKDRIILEFLGVDCNHCRISLSEATLFPLTASPLLRWLHCIACFPLGARWMPKLLLCCCTRFSPTAGEGTIEVETWSLKYRITLYYKTRNPGVHLVARRDLWSEWAPALTLLATQTQRAPVRREECIPVCFDHILTWSSRFLSRKLEGSLKI